MSTEPVESVESRLKGIESRLARFEGRLQVLESHSAPSISTSSAWVQPPPVLIREPQAKGVSPVDVPTKAPAKPDRAVNDIEYKIGLTGLLRGGAVVVIIGMLYLVALAISRGYITPLTQFIGEVALSLAFIGFGLLKRNVREDFGQLMVGIGSAGLYFSFAGAHVYKSLFSGETLVVLFVALSLANLGYAFWRSSKSFLALGFVGGFIASVLPMRDQNIRLDVVLHGLILIPSVLVIIRYRWANMAIALWVASSLALIPAYALEEFWIWRLAAVYVSALACAVAYAASYEASDFDPWCAFVPTALLAGGLAAVGLDSASHGSIHVLALSAGAVVFAALLPKQLPARNSLLFGAAAVVVALVPLGFTKLEAAFAYSAFAVITGLLSARVAPKSLAGLSWTAFSLGICAYLLVQGSGDLPALPVWTEVGVLAALIVGCLAGAYSSHQAGTKSEVASLYAGLLLLPAVCRIGFLVLTIHPSEIMRLLALVIPVLAFGIAATSIGTARRWPLMVGLGVASVVLSLLVYGSIAAEMNQAPWVESLLLLSLIAAVVYVGFGLSRTGNEPNPNAFELLVGMAGVIVGSLIVRMAVVLLATPFGPLMQVSAIATGSLAVMLLAAATFLLWRWRAGLFLAWLALIGACGSALSIGDNSQSGYSAEVALLIACAVATPLVTYLTLKVGKDRGAWISAGVASFWLMFSRLAFVVLTSPSIGLKAPASLTVAWTLLATALLVLGFAYRERALRYWGLAVFGATLLKVFVFDLAYLDPGIRVVLLLCLGLCMLGGGYWYIRSRDSLDSERTAAIKR